MRTTAQPPLANKRSDLVSLTLVLTHIGFVFTPVFLAAAIQPSAVLVGLWLWFGVCAHGLTNLMHEAAHRLVFCHRKASDFLGQWVLGPLFVADFDAYRERHWVHHNKFGEPEDTKDTYLVEVSGWGLLRLGANCLGLTEAAHKFLGQFRSRQPHTRQHNATGRAVVRFVTIQAVLAAALILVGCATSSWDILEGLAKGAMAYFGVYLYGIASLTVFVATLRAVAEHQRDAVDSVDVGRAALRNLRCNPLTRLIFGAYGFAEHATHHMWPSLPCYQLAQATETLAAHDPRLAPKQGYMSVLAALWRPGSSGR